MDIFVIFFIYHSRPPPCIAKVHTFPLGIWDGLFVICDGIFDILDGLFENLECSASDAVFDILDAGIF